MSAPKQVSNRNDILDMVFVGNPIMHHLFLGIDPTELGGAPFALAVSGAVHSWATDQELRVNKGARIYMLPCIAGHVGADAAAVTLCEGPHRQDKQMLVVDVGTNAEIVLGNREQSSPLLHPPARPLRARKSPVASAQHPEPSSASALTLKHSNQKSALSGSIYGPMRLALPKWPNPWASPAFADRRSSRWSLKCF